MRRWFVTLALAGFFLFPSTPMALAQKLEETLLAQKASELAAKAEASGDARLGAIVFHQSYLTCTQCHGINAAGSKLAPDLSKPEEGWKPGDIVQAILEPSAKIRKGYESIVVVKTDGTLVTGIVDEETAEQLVLRDAAKPGQTVTLSKKEIEERRPSPQSIMPKGLVHALGSEQQFLDLVKYLIEIGTGGTDRALALAPDPSTYALPPLPEYENNIDHAGIIRGLDAGALERGRKIYLRVCANCHGTHDQPGSLPTSLRFASGSFKNGSDPHRMYQTLTHGFGLMVAQRWMVPTQKYDVIHYIREEYVAKSNPSQYRPVTDDYLDSLPKGSDRGPKPVSLEPWVTMDYGQSLSATYEVGNDKSVFAHKGIAIRLDGGPGGIARGREWVVYDHDTMRLAGYWTGNGFIDWQGILFDGKHVVHPHVVGEVLLSNPTGPGWADPETGSFADRRVLGRDGRQYGPLPREWARFRGLYIHGERRVLEYTVGTMTVLESPSLAPTMSGNALVREMLLQPTGKETPAVGRRENTSIGGEKNAHRTVAIARLAKSGPLTSLETDHPGSKAVLIDLPDGMKFAAGVVGVADASWEISTDGQLRLSLPHDNQSQQFAIWVKGVTSKDEALAVEKTMAARPAPSLERLTRGGPPRWTERISRKILTRHDDGPFVVETLEHPDPNPWGARFRPTGFDFFPDNGRMAVCTWDGDVWMVEGIDRSTGETLTWRRIATGMFQPLGLKVVDGEIYVTCRDQLCKLVDLNGDGETDFYQCFNSDHQVTEHFHEFAMGLQVDAEGNFYYAKSACHAKKAVVPQHGTLLRVAKDGSETTILARGFRAANGVCLNGDGTYIVTDQEGHWNPGNRINWVREGGFYGNMLAYSDQADSSDDAMEQPCCWIAKEFDRSPAELLWLHHEAWGPLRGSLLNMSYGYGRLYLVPHESILGQVQGGMVTLPVPDFPTGILRGRIHSKGDLYLCGMYAWAGSRQEPGGLFRMRYTGKPVHVPVELRASEQGVTLRFSGRLDRARSADAKNFGVDVWKIKRTANYGSERFDQHPLTISSARLADDGQSIQLTIPEIAPTRCMEIRYQVWTEAGAPVQGKINNTIHRLRPPSVPTPASD